jgi:predicted nuclease of predicted toxin-antitoxin system
MKLLIDMNLSPRWVSVLSEAGWKTLHWSAVGKANARDSEVMDYAANNEYVVLTHDLDFSAILAATHGKKPSVVQLRTEDVSPPTMARQVVAALRHTAPELEAGALVTIGARQTRVRMLPIGTRD